MIFRSARAEGFRNLQAFELDFSPGVNWIYGPNGQGKSNFLESLLYVVSGRSQRTRRDEEIVGFGGDFFFISAQMEDDGGDQLQLSAAYSRSKGKKLRRDEEELKKISDLVSLSGTVVFGPGDVDLISGEPSLRRRYLDYSLAKTFPSYLQDILTYRRALRQKAMLLREGCREADLDIWNQSLADSGSRIILLRQENIAEIGNFAAGFYAELSGDKETLTLACSMAAKGGNEEEIRGSFMEVLEKHKSRELLKKRSLAGPHRDDMLIDIHGQNARKFASQGQRRSAAIALKLAQAEFLSRIRRDRPIVFLDDVFSELDEGRRENLCHLVGQKYQTFLATPRHDSVRSKYFSDAMLLSIDAGQIRQELKV